MKNRDLLIYRIIAGVFSVLMAFSATMYIVQHEMSSEMFSSLGFPTFIIYPLAIAKLSGITVLWISKSGVLKDWAYAGFVFNMLLATGGHINANDGRYAGALGGLILVSTSYFFKRKLDKAQAK